MASVLQIPYSRSLVGTHCRVNVHKSFRRNFVFIFSYAPAQCHAHFIIGWGNGKRIVCPQGHLSVVKST